jgi:hypothetical protein
MKTADAPRMPTSEHLKTMLLRHVPRNSYCLSNNRLKKRSDSAESLVVLGGR